MRRTERGRRRDGFFDSIMLQNLEMAMFTRETGRCMKCGTAVLYEVEECGETTATCPGCGQVLGWSPGFFE